LPHNGQIWKKLASDFGERPLLCSETI